MLSLLSSLEEGGEDEDDDDDYDFKFSFVLKDVSSFVQPVDVAQMVLMLESFLCKFVMTNNHCLVAVRENDSFSSVVLLFANNHYLVAEKEEDSSSYHEIFSKKAISLSCPETENKMVKKLHSEFGHASKYLLAVKNVSSSSFVLAKLLTMLSCEYGATPVAFFKLLELLSREGSFHATKSTPTRSGSDMLDTMKRDHMRSSVEPCFFVHHAVANVKAPMLVDFLFLGKFVFPQGLFSSIIPTVKKDAFLNDDYGRRSWSLFSTSPALHGGLGTASWNKDAELHGHYLVVHVCMWKGPSVHAARKVFAYQDTQHMAQGKVGLHTYMPRIFEFTVERSFCLIPFFDCLYPDIVLFMVYPADINSLRSSKQGYDASLFSFAAVFMGKEGLHAPLVSRNGPFRDVGLFSPLVWPNMAISCQSHSLDVVKHGPLLHATLCSLVKALKDLRSLTYLKIRHNISCASKNQRVLDMRKKAKLGFVFCFFIFPFMETVEGLLLLLYNVIYRTYGPCISFNGYSPQTYGFSTNQGPMTMLKISMLPFLKGQSAIGIVYLICFLICKRNLFLRIFHDVSLICFLYICFIFFSS